MENFFFWICRFINGILEKNLKSLMFREEQRKKILCLNSFSEVDINFSKASLLIETEVSYDYVARDSVN